MDRDIIAEAIGPLPFPSFWTIAELSRLLEIEEADVKRLVGRGSLPAYFIGGRWLISTADLIRWLILQRKTGGERNERKRLRQ
jgi:excisionase family DNA binding protein